MGVIFQDFVRYNFTAGDNIAVGRIDARDDRARIERGGAAQPGRRGHRASCRAGYDQRDRQALQERRRAVRRRMAEDRHRPRLHARGRRC